MLTADLLSQKPQPEGSTAPSASDPDLFGRLLDVATRTYKSIGVQSSSYDIGRIVAEEHNRIIAQTQDYNEQLVLAGEFGARLKQDIIRRFGGTTSSDHKHQA